MDIIGRKKKKMRELKSLEGHTEVCNQENDKLRLNLAQEWHCICDIVIKAEKSFIRRIPMTKKSETRKSIND